VTIETIIDKQMIYEAIQYLSRNKVATCEYLVNGRRCNRSSKWYFAIWQLCTQHYNILTNKKNVRKKW